MLLNLHIKNIAVIDELNIEFKTGFSAMTGETGAGKSIIIDAINMLLGGRVNKDIIRYGESKALVEAVFLIDNNETHEVLYQLGIEEEDGTVVICRDINTDGKGVCRVNGRITTAACLREIAKTIVNIHGQHDNQSLLNPAKHITFLDSYANTDSLLHKYMSVYNERHELISEIDTRVEELKQLQQKTDLLMFQEKEIKDADLSIDETEKLEARRNFLGEISNITETVNNARSKISECSGNVYDVLARVAASFDSISGYDETLGELCERLHSATLEIEDISFTLASYGDSLSYNPSELDKIEDRLEIIHDMQRKYGQTVEAVLDYYKKIKSELDTVKHSDEIIVELSEKLKNTEQRLAEIAEKLSEERKKAANSLEKKIKEQLCQLDMPNSEFVTQIEKCDFSPEGCDKVEFYISANAGEMPKPLSKVASGGEMSRIMLAIKTILSDADMVNTLIFDEIDTGVSGRAAGRIADKLVRLSKNKQVLCITHLAQIAAKADNHYLIEKNVSDGRTKTNVTMLRRDSRVDEIARIMGGSEITQTTRKAAFELINEGVEVE